MTAWMTHATEQAEYLEDIVRKEQAVHQSKADEEVFRRWLRELEDCKTAMLHRHAVLDSLTGNAIEKTWSRLHRIEVGLDEYCDIDRLVEVAKEKIRVRLPKDRVDYLIRKLDKSGCKEAALRTMALDAIREAHYASMQRHDSERNWQRGIVRICCGGLLAAVAMVLFQAFVVTSESIIPAPKGTDLSAWSLMTLVMFMGLLGGGLGALLSQYQIYSGERQISNTLWFNPMPVLSIAKLTLGLWMAFFGVLLVGTGVIVGVYPSLPALLLMAFVSGYGQQAVTKILDRKVGDMLEGKPGDWSSRGTWNGVALEAPSQATLGASTDGQLAR